jgi:biopolymer transport protein TolR
VNGIQLPQSEVVSRIQTALERSADRTVYLKGDRDAPWGAVMSMMDALRENGIETVALITERPGSNLPEGGR